MSSAKQKQKISPQIIEEAKQIAKATKKPGQTKEQTKLITQGIQKGIELYKKQQKGKKRELNKQLKKARTATESSSFDSHIQESNSQEIPSVLRYLPWILLVVSWLGFGLWQANYL